MDAFMARTLSSRMAVAEYAATYLDKRRERLCDSLPLTRAAVRDKLAAIPTRLETLNEHDVAVVAKNILLGTRMLLTGSDFRRSYPDFSNLETIRSLIPGGSGASTSLALPSSSKRKTLQGSYSGSKGCRAPGCGRPLAPTSSCYCSEHVGSTAMCSIKDCNRVAESGEGDVAFCRKHMQEASLDGSKSSSAGNVGGKGKATTSTSSAPKMNGSSNAKPSSLSSSSSSSFSTSSSSAARSRSNLPAVQNPVTKANPAAAPADYDLPRGATKRCIFDECEKSARGASWFCIQHGGGKRCQFYNCSRSARGATNFCVTHGGGKRCSVPLCPKSAVGPTNLCIAHGGGKRCQYPECTHSAEGGTSFCIRHGGGRRCKTQDCNKSAVGTTDYCVACGGGKRCSEPGCAKSAVGSTAFCKAHGGGKRCGYEGCTKSAQGASSFCIQHGGASGKRCSLEGCNNLASSYAGDICWKHFKASNPQQAAEISAKRQKVMEEEDDDDSMDAE